MKTYPTPHLEKLKATLENDKLPADDRHQVEMAIGHYEQWIANMDAVMKEDIAVDQQLQKMVDLLNQYRIRMDIDLIFDSHHDWLYRQKGQIKLDNSVIEEFLHDNPCRVKVFKRFLDYIRQLLDNEPLNKETVLERGYF